MKTLIPILLRCAAPVSVPVPGPKRTEPRPVRRGHFWPGENAIRHNQRWIECGALPDQPFALPPFVGGGSPS